MAERIKLDEHGRRIGESAPRAKLTEREVAAIKKFWHEGLGSKVLLAKKGDARRPVKR